MELERLFHISAYLNLLSIHRLYLTQRCLFLLSSDIAKTLLPGLSTYTPDQIYACHVFLTKNAPYFDLTPRGFKCRAPGNVLWEQEKEDVFEEERVARELFVAKLRYKLNQLKAQRQAEASQERTRVTSGKGTHFFIQSSVE
jgi:hypothetical protein